MPDFVVGEWYPMTQQQANAVMSAGRPLVSGTPDLSRGRRFLKATGDWEFWTTDGRKVSCSFGAALIVSQSRVPDPERPEPLLVE
jgi:hypothetical protein